MEHIYYCDQCGHVFSIPKVKKWTDGEDEVYDDERCPKCNNPDFEPITSEGELEEV